MDDLIHNSPNYIVQLEFYYYSPCTRRLNALFDHESYRNKLRLYFDNFINIIY